MRGWCVACGLVLAIGGPSWGGWSPLMPHFRGFLGTMRHTLAIKGHNQATNMSKQCRCIGGGGELGSKGMSVRHQGRTLSSPRSNRAF